MQDNQHYIAHAVVFGVQTKGENLKPKPNHEQEIYIKSWFHDNSS